MTLGNYLELVRDHLCSATGKGVPIIIVTWKMCAKYNLLMDAFKQVEVCTGGADAVALPSSRPSSRKEHTCGEEGGYPPRFAVRQPDDGKCPLRVLR